MLSTIHSTRPDFVVYVPRVTSEQIVDTGNEHFMVFDGPDKSLMTIWSQSSFEGQGDQHIVFARSTDQGRTWSAPKIIAGPARPGEGYSASWAVPLVSKSGRIYVLYCQSGPQMGRGRNVSTWLTGIYSDDAGKTWSRPQTIDDAAHLAGQPGPVVSAQLHHLAEAAAADAHWPLPRRHDPHDQPRGEEEPRQTLDLDRHRGRVPALRRPRPRPGAGKAEDFVACLRQARPDPAAPGLPADQRLPGAFHREAAGRAAILCHAHHVRQPGLDPEPRRRQTWTPPRCLLRKDGGQPLLHPLSPCPIYDLGGNTAGSGRYALFIHNHDGHYQEFGPTDSHYHRRPIYLVAGRFKPGAEQPVWFDEPRFFMDHDGVPLGPPGKRGRLDLAMYSSLTILDGKPVLWYPDRKFFLLGKYLPADLP